MTQPREIIQGATYLLTRRILHRRFLLRPDAATTRFILYSLAIAAERFEIQINAFCAMSTHIHLVVTDPKELLPKFLHCFHKLVAMGIQLLRNWAGAVWDNARTSVVRLITPKAIAEKISYTLANPVIAGAVRYAREWPGAKNLVEDIGVGVHRAARPNIYFTKESSKWPKEATLRLHLPPMITDPVEFRQNVTDLVAHEEKKAHFKQCRRSKRKKQRAATISPHKRATSKELRYTANPTFAVGHDNKDAYDAARAALRSFRTAYRNALAQWRAGHRDVQFPQGTWWMRVFHKANTHESTTITSFESLPKAPFPNETK